MTSDRTLSIASTVVATTNHLSAEVAGETVIMDNESGNYFGFNSLGTKVWTLIQSPQTVNDLCEAVMAQYEVGRDQCEQDILTLLQGLAAEGLVDIR